MSSLGLNAARSCLRWPSTPTASRSRRPRNLALENLEDRTLLAKLEITGTLGEQSALNSVVQAPQFLQDLNSGESEKFTHNKSPAYSAVTLKAGASDSG